MRKYITMLHKRVIYLMYMAFFVLFGFNIAQPGLYNSGGATFTMLYPQDSVSYKKVQMVEEHVAIQLYKGFAVVKGVYTMHNTTTDSLQFTMGYPKDGLYHGNGVTLNQVAVDSLYQFKVVVNGDEQPIAKRTVNAQQLQDHVQLFHDNWSVWDVQFLPNETKNIAVYFLVNTNNAIQREGYSKTNANAFIYLVESGLVWKQPIQNAYFRVEFMEDALLETIHKINPSELFKKVNNRAVLLTHLIAFSPLPEDNVIFTYSERDHNLHFEDVLPQSEKLFLAVDAFSNESFTADMLEDFYLQKKKSKTTIILACVLCLAFIITVVFKKLW